MGVPEIPERRRHSRFAIPSVELKCYRPALVAFLRRKVAADLQNLSASGLRGRTQEALKKGDRLQGSILVPETSDRVSFDGEIRWACRTVPEYRGEEPPTIFGLAFVRMDPGTQAKIESMRRWFTSDRCKTTRRFARG